MVNKIGIDTNVLIRYITQDDDGQSKIASDFLESLTTQNQGFINHVVMVEVVWVLSRAYKKSRAQIAMILDEILSIPVFEFENRQVLLQALHLYKTTKADYSDLVIYQINKTFSCNKTVTFDKIAYEKAGMTSIIEFQQLNK